MTLWGLWVLGNVLTAHDTITRGIFAQLAHDLRPRRWETSGRTTRRKR